MYPQLFISHSHKISDKICNCTMCPIFGYADLGLTYSRYHYCPLQEGIIKEPELCWCKPGLVYMWIKTHAPSEIVDLLGEIK